MRVCFSWFDADTVVMNPDTPLEVFLPPTRYNLSSIHMLMASNWDGLNSGAFALRVHPWSVSLLSAVLAYPIYQRGRVKTDRFRDQSAFQWLLNTANPDSPLADLPFNGRDHWADVPMRWFNSFPFNNAFAKSGDWVFNHNMTDALFEKGTMDVLDDGLGGLVQPWKVMRGDLVVHFAGSRDVRDSWMGPWLDRAEANLPEWRNKTKTDDLKLDVDTFWVKVARYLEDARARLEKLEREQKAALERVAAQQAAHASADAAHRSPA